MRRITTFLLAMLAVTALSAQRPVADQARMQQTAGYRVKLNQIIKSTTLESKAPQANAVTPLDQVNQSAGKTAGTNAVSPVAIGRASNAYSILRAEQNQVYANSGLDLVAFIHRQDVTIWGGGGSANGKLRYDVSTDNGASFTSDIGVLNQFYIRPARYPQISGYNPSGNTNPFAATLMYNAPVLDPSPSWDGHVNGLSDVTTGTPTPTEAYDFIGQQTLLPGGLCQGLDKEFWATDVQYDGASTLDEIYIYKGVYDDVTPAMTWTRHASINPGHYKGFDGGVTLIGTNIAFSPNGMDGWVGWLGDLIGGHDSVLSPCFIKTTDGGATWGNAMEVDLRTIAWIKDSLQSFWADSLGGPAGSGRPTTGFDFDLTVDATGNPHLVAVCGHATTGANPDPGYSIFSGIEKFIIDVYSTDGGTTWDAKYVAPVLAFRGEFGTPDPTDGSLLTMDNVVQVSRSENGNKIFYSWVDSDTVVTGFGESNNIAPNLRISACDITTGFRTCYLRVSDGDLLWDGNLLFPTMAPTVLQSGSDWNLPIVFLQMLQNDQLAPCQFHYIGGDAKFNDADFMDPALINTQWGSDCYNAITSISPVDEVNTVGLTSYPNPAFGSTNVKFTLEQSGDINLNLYNVHGQQVMALANGKFNAGVHEINVNTSDLPAGIYMTSLKVGEKNYSDKIVVVK